MVDLFMGEMAQRTSREQRYIAPILTGWLRWKYWTLVAIWLGLIGFFWSWWLSPEHNVGGVRYGAATAVLGWMSFLQFYFAMIFLRASRPVARLEQLGHARVAMVVTKAPSESFDVVRRTLEAMLAQDYPHDTWLADEDPSEETEAWCAAHGVRISTRRGVEAYHRAEWPRRTRCKEGNLAYFYDMYGYDAYDFVVQLDADHVPQQSYLREMIRPFADPAVGYVSAPSICASNAADSWAARARLYSEGLFHGALQSGYSNGWAPMCIGSHYAVRTKALRQIGGLGPELAEDHSTSMIMNSNGWRGVHALDAIAVGDGPASYADMVTQEFQWSRSLMTLLLQFTPRYFAGLRPILKFQFLFSQIWYPVFAIFMATTFVMPIWAIVGDVRFADVTFPDFLLHSVPATSVLILIAYQIRRDGLSRPARAKVISWERTLFPLAQWPWVMWGCLLAVYDRFRGKFVDFRVTPKGAAGQAPLPPRVLAPVAFLVIASVVPVMAVNDTRAAAGFYIFAIVNAALYTALFITILVMHRKENPGPRRWHVTPAGAARTATALALVGLVWLAVSERGMQGLHAITTGLGPWQFVQVKSVVSGAGSGNPGSVAYVFGFKEQ